MYEADKVLKRIINKKRFNTVRALLKGKLRIGSDHDNMQYTDKHDMIAIDVANQLSV